MDYSLLATNRRMSGILLHPTSFPSPYGIGDLGKGAYAFIDFLKEANQSLWQVLPLGPTGYGDSPYQSFSSFAGQPLLISPEPLIEHGLLTDEDLGEHTFAKDNVDYGPIIQYKFSLYQKAYNHLIENPDHIYHKEWNSFCQEADHWLRDYALFMACKDAHEGLPWIDWEEDMAHPTAASREVWCKKLARDVSFYTFIQFLFYKQWHALKTYAHSHGIYIIGDIPLFTSYDSSDVWANRRLFQLDHRGLPTSVAGVPPDYFSATGQLWGNPLYDWKEHKKDDFCWWVERLAHTLRQVDIVRIDHFRGFESYWSIPYGNETAIHGSWQPGPGGQLLEAFMKALGHHLPIIAEDLGIITEEVRNLRDTYHLPGMKVLQFAFESHKDNDFLPHWYPSNSVCYSGTHDNDTSLGWYEKANEKSRLFARTYMKSHEPSISWDFIRTCYSSVSKMAIVPLQDLLSLDSHSRMNTPGSPMGNWQWRYTGDMLTPELANRLRDMTNLYGRS